MHIKIIKLLNLFTIISVTTSLPAPGKNGLLRTPKVYNAVITTDDNLAPSRAFPLIQPYIHEQPIAFSSFNGITSFGHPFSGFYDYSGFHGNGYGGYAPGLNIAARPNGKIQSRNKEEPAIQAENQEEIQNPEQISSETTPTNANVAEATVTSKPENVQPAVNDKTKGSEQQQQQNEQQPGQDEQPPQNADKSPIPLNEFGLPPSLVPFSSYGQTYPSHINNQYNLQPFQYQSYPLIYDSFNGYHQGNPLLPPFTFYPPSSVGNSQASPDAFEDNFQKGRSLSQPSAFGEQSILGLEARDDSTPQQSSQQPNTGNSNGPSLQPFPTGDVINYANKNKSIPDVPPPPLPTSRKTQ